MDIDLCKVQHQLDWLKQKLFLDCKSCGSKMRTVKKGQVYECELGIGVGNELQKNRPCVIIQNDIGNMNSPKTVVAPITHTYKENLNCFIPVSDKIDLLGKVILNGYVNISEIRSIDKARLGDYICKLNNEEVVKIDKAISINLDSYHHYNTLKNMYNDKLNYIEKLNKTLTDIKMMLNVNNNNQITEKLKELLDKAK